MRSMDIDLTTHRSQPLNPQLIRDADVIYTMTGSHRDAVLDGLNPGRSPDSYTIQSYVVTKQVPLVHKYMETGVLRAFEFLEVVVAG